MVEVAAAAEEEEEEKGEEKGEERKRKMRLRRRWRSMTPAARNMRARGKRRIEKPELVE